MRTEPSAKTESRRTRISALLLCAVILAGCPRTGRESIPEEVAIASPPVELKAEVDRAEAKISEPVTFRITLEADPALSVDLPEVGAQIQGFRIVDMGKEGPKRREGRIWSRRWYELRADLAGSYLLPGMRLAYTDTEGKEHVAETPQLFVEVKSVLSQRAEDQDIRDLKPLEQARRELPGTWLYLSLGALALLGSISGLLLYFRRKRQTEQTPRTPEALAREELVSLEATGLLEEERYREYVFGLSLIFRRYLERRFRLPAAEQTTEEIFASLRNAEHLDKALKETARSFLEETDPIKYRGLEPRPAETEAWRSFLIAFMERAVQAIDIREAA